MHVCADTCITHMYTHIHTSLRRRGITSSCRNTEVMHASVPALPPPQRSLPLSYFTPAFSSSRPHATSVPEEMLSCVVHPPLLSLYLAHLTAQQDGSLLSPLPVCSHPSLLPVHPKVPGGLYLHISDAHSLVPLWSGTLWFWLPVTMPLLSFQVHGALRL